MWWRHSLKNNKCHHFETNQYIKNCHGRFTENYPKPLSSGFNSKKYVIEFHIHPFKAMSPMLLRAYPLTKLPWLSAASFFFLSTPSKACSINDFSSLILSLFSFFACFDSEIFLSINPARPFENSSSRFKICGIRKVYFKHSQRKLYIFAHGGGPPCSGGPPLVPGGPPGGGP